MALERKVLIWLCLGIGAFAAYTSFAEVEISPGSRSFSKEFGGGGIITSGEGSWVATTTCDWITIQPNTEGVAGSYVTYVVDANTNVETRTGVISINGLEHIVTQAGHDAAITISATEFNQKGGLGEISIQTDEGAHWNLFSSASWVAISKKNGVGSSSVTFRVEEYDGLPLRVAEISVAGRIYEVRQTGPTLKMSETNMVFSCHADEFSVHVEALPETSWSLESDAEWISVSDNMPLLGSKTVRIQISSNNENVLRRGRVSVGNRGFYVTQVGQFKYDDSLLRMESQVSSFAMNGGGEKLSFTVNPTNLEWKATVDREWLHVLGPTSGIGDACVSYGVDPNTSITDRLGHVDFQLASSPIDVELDRGLYMFKGENLGVVSMTTNDCEETIGGWFEVGSANMYSLVYGFGGGVDLYVDADGGLVFRDGCAQHLDFTIVPKEKYGTFLVYDGWATSFYCGLFDSGEYFKLFDRIGHLRIQQFGAEGSDCNVSSNYYAWGRALKESELRAHTRCFALEGDALRQSHLDARYYCPMSMPLGVDVVSNECFGLNALMANFVSDRYGWSAGAMSCPMSPRARDTKVSRLEMVTATMPNTEVYQWSTVVDYRQTYYTGSDVSIDYYKMVPMEDLPSLNDVVAGEYYHEGGTNEFAYNLWVQTPERCSGIISFGIQGPGVWKRTGYDIQTGIWSDAIEYLHYTDSRGNVKDRRFKQSRTRSYVGTTSICHRVSAKTLSIGPEKIIVEGHEIAVNCQPGSWHMISFCRSGGGASLYVDGKPLGSFPTGTLYYPDMWSADLAQGSGAVDELSIYEKGLTAEEIVDLYEASKPIIWSHEVVQRAEPPTVSVSNLVCGAGAALFDIDVHCVSNVEWSVSGLPDWLTVDGDANFVGAQTVKLKVAENLSCSTRRTTIQIAGKSVGIIQEGCEVCLICDKTVFGADGGVGTLTVRSERKELAWSVEKDCDWITFLDNTDGFGTKEIMFVVNPQENSVSVRQGMVSIGGSYILIRQGDSELANPGDVLGMSELSFEYSGNAGWTCVEFAGGVATRAMKSGVITHGQRSGLKTVLQGCGTLSFMCRVSSEYANGSACDGLAVYVDGDERRIWVGGETDWTNVTVTVSGEGEHVITWSYEKDADGDGGEDCAWIRDVEWAGTAHRVSFDANGGSGSMPNVSVSCGDRMTLPQNEFTREGYEFFGWSTTAEGLAIGTGGETVAAPKASASGVITLFAVWKPENVLTISSRSLEVASSGGDFSIAVNADTNVTWRVESWPSWVSVGTGLSGCGNGVVEACALANTGFADREGCLQFGAKHFASGSDLYRGLVLWITERNNIEGNEHRELDHPLSRPFDGSFWTKLSGPAFPAKDNDDFSLAFSFKVDQLGITNEIMKIANHSIYLDDDNVLWCHKLNTHYRVTEPGRFHTVIVQNQAVTQDHGTISIFAGERGGDISLRMASSNEWHIMTCTAPVEMSRFLLGHGAYPMVDNFRSGKIENLRIWNRVLSPIECAMADELGSCAITAEGVPLGLPDGVAYEYLALCGNGLQVSQTNIVPKVQNASLSNWTPAVDRHGGDRAAVASTGCGRVVLNNFDDRFSEGECDATYSVWVRVDEFPMDSDSSILDRAIVKDGALSEQMRLNVSMTQEGRLRVYTGGRDSTALSENVIATNVWYMLTVVGRAGKDVTLYLDGEPIRAISTSISFGYHDQIASVSGKEAVFTLGGWNGAAQGLAIIHGALSHDQVKTLYESQNAGNVSCEVRQKGAPIEVSVGSLFVTNDACSSIISVETMSGVPWTVQSLSDWVVIDGNTNRSGSAEIGLSIEKNPSLDERVGMLWLAGRPIIITQAGDPSAVINVDPGEVSLPVGSNSVSISISASDGVAWVSESSCSWMSVVSGRSGSGSGTISCSADLNEGDEIRTGSVTVRPRNESVTPDLYRDMLIWIKDRENIEGNECRWMSYPLDMAFDGTFKNCLNGCGLPEKSNREMTLAFSFRLSGLGRLNPLFELTDSRCWAIDEENHLHYYKKGGDVRLDFIVENPNEWYTIVLRYRSTGDNCFYFGKTGELLEKSPSQGYGNDLYSSIQDVTDIRFGYCHYETPSYLRGGQIANVRFWTRALVDEECRQVDSLESRPMSEDDVPNGVVNGVAWDHLPLDGNAFRTTSTNIMPIVSEVHLSNWVSAGDRYGRAQSAISSGGDGRVVISDFNNWFSEGEANATYSLWMNVKSLPSAGDVPVLRRVLYSAGREQSNARLIVSVTPEGTMKILTGSSKCSESNMFRLLTNEWNHVAVVGRGGKNVDLYLNGLKIISHASDIKLGHLSTSWDSQLEVGGWNGAVDGLSILHSTATDDEVRSMCRLSGRCRVSQLPEDKPLPMIGKFGTDKDVDAALFWAEDAKLKACIEGVEQYVQLREWALKIQSGDGDLPEGPTAVLNSPLAWISFALRSESLLQRSPTAGDLKVKSLLPVAAKSFELGLSLEGVKVGSGASVDDLRKMFWVEGTSDLKTGTFSVDSVEQALETPKDGSLRFSIRPKDPSVPSFFVRPVMNSEWF